MSDRSSTDELTLQRLSDARLGRRVVFTNGVFDILHRGHLKLLEFSRAQGDLLVVGLNSDSSVQRLGKGPNRPYTAWDDRRALLLSLRMVDFVLGFDEESPLELMKKVRPDVHVKGGDYTFDSLPEGPLVISSGGIVMLFPILSGNSSTNLAKKMNLE